jgi:hypothetical protein
MAKISRGATRAVLVGLLVLLPLAAFPANVIVPSLELLTRGAMDSGTIFLKTYGQIDLSVEGGYKFGGKLDLRFTTFAATGSSDIETAASKSLAFNGASIVVRDVFSLPIDISYFIGQNDTLCSGEGFSAAFGAGQIMTSYRGFMYFPTGVIYDGIYTVNGTGARIDIAPSRESLLISLYGYEDTHPPITGSASFGSFSGDLRVLANIAPVKLEGFLGGSYSASTAPSGRYRGGLLFYWNNDPLELLAQVGVPVYDPNANDLSLNLCYFLFEPRLHLGILSIVPTFFLHPLYYEQALNTSEQGSFDINLNIYAGDLVRSAVRGGLETLFNYNSSTGDIAIKASPYIGFATQGALWTFKVTAKLAPLDTATMLEAFVGVRAEF